jgi:hypothetical protein
VGTEAGLDSPALNNLGRAAAAGDGDGTGAGFAGAIGGAATGFKVGAGFVGAIGGAATSFKVGADFAGAIGGAATGFAVGAGFASPALNNLGRAGAAGAGDEIGVGLGGGVLLGLNRRGLAGFVSPDLSDSFGKAPGLNNFGPFFGFSSSEGGESSGLSDIFNRFPKKMIIISYIFSSLNIKNIVFLSQELI